MGEVQPSLYFEATAREAGGMEALATVWNVEIEPLQKLLLVGYANSPQSVADIARWAGVTEKAAIYITKTLVAAELVREFRQPEPSWGELRQIVFERDGRFCRHCGATSELSIDHIFPRSLGGADDPGNLQVLCTPCNSRKGARVEGAV